MLYEWKDAYSVGYDDIDNEHRIFIKLSIRFQEMNIATDKQIIARYLDELEKYAEFHFLSEENRMIDVDYPQLAEHIKQHRNLLEELSEKKSRILSGKLPVTALVPFLLEWFVKHTTGNDQKFVSFMKSKNRWPVY